MNMEDSVTIGRRLRRTRRARGKSLRVVAGLAGISASYLCRLELSTFALCRELGGDRSRGGWDVIVT